MLPRQFELLRIRGEGSARDCVLRIICGALFDSPFEPMNPHMAAAAEYLQIRWIECEMRVAIHGPDMVDLYSIPILGGANAPLAPETLFNQSPHSDREPRGRVIEAPRDIEPNLSIHCDLREYVEDQTCQEVANVTHSAQMATVTNTCLMFCRDRPHSRKHIASIWGVDPQALIARELRGQMPRATRIGKHCWYSEFDLLSFRAVNQFKDSATRTVSRWGIERNVRRLGMAIDLEINVIGDLLMADMLEILRFRAAYPESRLARNHDA